ncbi:hypothetical protein XELAEV_18033614mg [Xenopus laevis]|uniref:Uncharacterized protein n=1 Tax=Xenopus laevis TaxID=8355 RepID=A0A974HE69_XENLA|nr:hypothetical protein XELAEV_18033614mg [Xenopus laevis]
MWGRVFLFFNKGFVSPLSSLLGSYYAATGCYRIILAYAVGTIDETRLGTTRLNGHVYLETLYYSPVYFFPCCRPVIPNP